ncbi:thioredoxin family protein [Bittarella massiliensis (ex Durand et al. 2017)]|uniref:thioredoxin family protein n=1 Tax=Bittarella massiliensis (ex Durand et al. 2017) TaxID=1720313 RepID=UPI001AA14300|nr:thioredoxin family protein [Bittarella massiliensis (ex Durand et al. 2017)]MBO1679347.1 thioredoxin family protein [Bittarella massiliensis (ex Durand et al. 2017)]
MAVTVKEMDGAALEQLVKTGAKVLADFYSKTCGPCKMLGFVLNDVAKEVDGVEIVKICFEENSTAVKAHRVEGYPTMILFEGGAEKARLKGLQQKPLIVSTIAG